MSFPCNVWFQFPLAIMIRQLGHRYWPCFHPCITRVDIKLQADDRLTSCKFISEFIDGTDDHPAMFTLSIRAWLSPPELPYVRSLLALSSDHASVLHVLLAFLLTTVFCAVRPGRSKRLVRGVLRGGKESEKCEPVIAFLRRSSSRVSRVKCNTSDGENGHCLTARLPPSQSDCCNLPDKSMRLPVACGYRVIDI